MPTLFDQVALALKPYHITQTGLMSFPERNLRIYFDFRVHDKRILIDVHPKSSIKIHPEIALKVAKKDKKQSERKKQLAAKCKYTYIEIRSPEDITTKLLPYLVPIEDSR